MKQHRESMTSEMVAMYRAIHASLHDPVLVDPYAKSLIRRLWRVPVHSRLMYQLALRAGFRFDWGIAQCMARSRIAEDRLDELRARGPVQWVLLGAGLDMFAWRRQNLGDVRQFEVDHPATQRGKRAKLAKLGLESPAGHRFVEVDFERETASQKLREAGFSTDTPTVFAWLGVTYYLRKEAIEASLGDVRSIAAPGSWLVCDYRMTDRHLREDERGPVARGDRFFARWGEPMLSKFEPEELHELVARAGWKLEREHTAQDMANRFFPANRDGLRPTSTYHVVELVPG